MMHKFSVYSAPAPWSRYDYVHCASLYNISSWYISLGSGYQSGSDSISQLEQPVFQFRPLDGNRNKHTSIQLKHTDGSLKDFTAAYFEEVKLTEGGIINIDLHYTIELINVSLDLLSDGASNCKE